jgi:hypothetical protein
VKGRAPGGRTLEVAAVAAGALVVARVGPVVIVVELFLSMDVAAVELDLSPLLRPLSATSATTPPARRTAAAATAAARSRDRAGAGASALD